MDNKVILIGLGPYAFHTYYSFYKNKEIVIKYIIDLKSKKDYLEKMVDKSIELFFVDDKYKDEPILDEKTKNFLDRLVNSKLISHAIIATEPKSHFAYASYFIKNGINVLIEKPVLVEKGMINNNVARKLFNQHVNELMALYDLQKEKINASVMCQRRYNNAYIFLKKYIADIISRYNIGITSMHISSNDGMWNMPNEIFLRENHPYKYGYGKLMHSGYHYIDLALLLLEENKKLDNKEIKSVEIKSSCVQAKDYFAQITNQDYQNIFSNEIDYSTYYQKDTTAFGEFDLYSTIKFNDQNGNTLSVVTFDLLQNSLSRRAWTNLPQDTYRANGRTKQNFIDICLGPLVNIKIFVEQAYNKNEQRVKYDLGDTNHFSIYITRNSSLIGGKPLEKYSISNFEKDNDKYDTNDYCRLKCLLSFLNNKKGQSDLKSHINTLKLINLIYESLAKNIQRSFEL